MGQNESGPPPPLEVVVEQLQALADHSVALTPRGRKPGTERRCGSLSDICIGSLPRSRSRQSPTAETRLESRLFAVGWSASSSPLADKQSTTRR